MTHETHEFMVGDVVTLRDDSLYFEQCFLDGRQMSGIIKKIDPTRSFPYQIGWYANGRLIYSFFYRLNDLKFIGGERQEERDVYTNIQLLKKALEES